jgi:RHS repeat-associated protein
LDSIDLRGAYTGNLSVCAHARLITNAAGTIKAESDYYPWGGEFQFVNNDSNDYKFTGKKRDAETGLDYFGARYYSNGLGRWISADWSARPVVLRSKQRVGLQ